MSTDLNTQLLQEIRDLKKESLEIQKQQFEFAKSQYERAEKIQDKAEALQDRAAHIFKFLFPVMIVLIAIVGYWIWKLTF